MNRLLAIGVLTEPPRRTETRAGNIRCSFTVAARQPAQSFNCVAWNDLAEQAAGLRPGQKVYLAGRMRGVSYRDNLGRTRFSMDVNVTELQPVHPAATDEPGAKTPPRPNPTAPHGTTCP